MIENSEIKRFGANMKIYEEGAIANSLFFILSGKILLKKSEVGIFA
jgi:CRP-like cAMP-binding protein